MKRRPEGQRRQKATEAIGVPEQASTEYVFRPEQEISDQDWQNIFEYVGNRMRGNRLDAVSAVEDTVSAMKMLNPSKISELRAYIDSLPQASGFYNVIKRELESMLSQGQKEDGGLPLSYTAPTAASLLHAIRELYPDHHDYDVIPKRFVDFFSTAEEYMASTRGEDEYLHFAATCRLLDPEIYRLVSIDEGVYTRWIQLFHEDADTDNAVVLGSTLAILFPDRAGQIQLTPDQFEDQMQKFEEMRSSSAWVNAISRVALLAVVSAERIHITEDGDVQVEFSPEKPAQSPPLPDRLQV